MTAGVDGAVDGSDGRLFIEPSAGRCLRARARASRRPRLGVVGSSGAAAANGVRVVANVASALEAEAAVRAGAEGIGLVRTELLFLGRSTPPTVGEQRATYARILEVMGDRPVVFRTLDVGGDKPAEWHRPAPRRTRRSACAAAAWACGARTCWTISSPRCSRPRLVASSG